MARLLNYLAECRTLANFVSLIYNLQMNNWIYTPTRKVILSEEDLPNHEQLVGFVYKITNLQTGKFYIGKKSLQHSRKTRISKKEKATTGSRKTFKKVVKQSDWLTYHGSSIDLKADVSTLGAENFKREIIELCCTKKYLAYCELAWQVKHDVLRGNCYNGNILGRYYARDMENCKS